MSNSPKLIYFGGVLFYTIKANKVDQPDGIQNL